MTDAPFYDAPLHGHGTVGRVMVPARRLARKLLIPIFGRLVEILNEVVRRLDSADAADAAQSERTGRAEARLAALESQSPEVRQELADVRAGLARLREDLGLVTALHWDQTALARRLAQLEDRLIGVAPSADGEESAAIPFPGIERLERYVGRPGDAADGQSRVG